MRILRAMLAAAVVAMAGMSPAAAATMCTCGSGQLTSGGVCTSFDSCHFVPVAMSKPLRSVKACRHSQAIVCDFDTCKLVCATDSQ